MAGIASAATGRRDRAHRRGHDHDQGRCRRDHASQPLAARDRRAVRHARSLASRPDRSRARPRAGNRSADDACAAAVAVERRQLSAGCPRAAGAARRSRSRGRSCTRSREPARTFRCGFSVRASSARSSPRCSGLPYAFASHFAPDALLPALEIYRAEFRPSEQLERPYAMVAANVIAADDEREARRLFTS